MIKIKKSLVGLSIIIAGYIVWAQCYKFNIDQATTYLTEHGRNKSIHCCAWYSMRALQAGGCPAIILPAQWYKYFMPIVQFEEVTQMNYHPKAGDVVVFERPSWKSWSKISQWWGHVAMYNGKQWISDFKQKRMNPYKTEVPYRLYRYEK